MRGCRRDNQELETALTQQLAAYDRGAEELTGADALRRAVVRGDRGECLEANRLLYDFTNQQKLRAYFVLLGADMQVLSSNFSAHNQSIFASSAFGRGRCDAHEAGTGGNAPVCLHRAGEQRAGVRLYALPRRAG